MLELSLALDYEERTVYKLRNKAIEKFTEIAETSYKDEYNELLIEFNKGKEKRAHDK